jgi:hypothetical protein
MLILFPATLQNSLILGGFYLVDFGDFCVCGGGGDFLHKQWCLLQIANFVSSIPFYPPSISFSNLAVLARTSRTMLNSYCDSRHLCLIYQFREKLLISYPLSIILTVAIFIDVLYEVKVCFYLYFSESFYNERCWILQILFLQQLIWLCDYTHWLSNIRLA